MISISHFSAVIQRAEKSLQLFFYSAQHFLQEESKINLVSLFLYNLSFHCTMETLRRLQTTGRQRKEQLSNEWLNERPFSSLSSVVVFYACLYTKKLLHTFCCLSSLQLHLLPLWLFTVMQITCTGPVQIQSFAHSQNQITDKGEHSSRDGGRRWWMVVVQTLNSNTQLQDEKNSSWGMPPWHPQRPHLDWSVNSGRTLNTLLPAPLYSTSTWISTDIHTDKQRLLYSTMTSPLQMS